MMELVRSKEHASFKAISTLLKETKAPPGTPVLGYGEA